MKFPKLGKKAVTKIGTGALLGLIITAVVGALIGYDLAADIYDEAEDYNTTYGGTQGKMATLFAGTIFIIGLGIAIVKGFGII